MAAPPAALENWKHGDDLPAGDQLSDAHAGETRASDVGLLGKEKSMALLDQDLPRTFPQYAFFHQSGLLRNVLETFVCYRPDIGYVQGEDSCGPQANREGSCTVS